MFTMQCKMSNLYLSCTDPTKFFGCELGAQTQFDFKNNRFIVNGSHDANKLQDLLDIFIKKYVLCPECDNPETFLVRVLLTFVLEGVSQNLSSVTNDSFFVISYWNPCFWLIISRFVTDFCHLSLIFVICHWKKALWNTPLVMISLFYYCSGLYNL